MTSFFQLGSGDVLCFSVLVLFISVPFNLRGSQLKLHACYCLSFYNFFSSYLFCFLEATYDIIPRFRIDVKVSRTFLYEENEGPG